MTLPELRDRLTKATGPDRELDVAIYAIEIPEMADMWPHWNEEDRDLCVPAFTDSVDAALALVERVLPGTRVALEHFPDHGFCVVSPNTDDERWAEAATLPIAILLALIEALISKDKP